MQDGGGKLAKCRAGLLHDGMNDLLPLAEEIGTILKARRQTIGVSESSSGGLVSAALLAQSGASAYFRGGGVIYAPAAFKGLMGLSKEDIGDMGIAEYQKEKRANDQLANTPIKPYPCEQKNTCQLIWLTGAT